MNKLALLSIVNCRLLIVLGLSLIFSLFTFHFSITSVHAQNACSVDPTLTAQGAIDKINKCAIEADIFDDKIFNLNQIAGTTDSIYNLLTGRSQLHPQTDNITAGTGALAASGNLVVALYSTPPVSGVNYLANQVQKFNPVQPAYAQTGIGFDSLSPIQPIWTVFRNASYVGFVIVFIIIGFMVMFRAHISPQAVATVQDSLPRIVIALILVTFSYAIAGLMIDVMFLTLNIVINLLQQTPFLNSQANIVFEKSVFGVTFNVWDETVKSVASAIANAIDQIVDIGALEKILGFFGGGLAGIIAGIAILFVMFRVFFMLLISYVTIVILTIFAPFLFLLQALPGNNGAKNWFKQMAANIAVFPVVAIMFIFAGMIGGLQALGGSGASGFTTDQIGQFPLLSGDLQFDAIGKLLGFGFILMTPSAAKMVKERIGVKEGGVGFGAGAAALGAGAAAFTRPIGAVTSPVARSAQWKIGEGVVGRIGPHIPVAGRLFEPGGKPAPKELRE